MSIHGTPGGAVVGSLPQLRHRPRMESTMLVIEFMGSPRASGGGPAPPSRRPIHHFRSYLWSHDIGLGALARPTTAGPRGYQSRRGPLRTRRGWRRGGDPALDSLYGSVADQHGQDGERYHDPHGCPEVDGGDDHESVEQGDQDEPEVVDVSGLVAVRLV